MRLLDGPVARKDDLAGAIVWPWQLANCPVSTRCPCQSHVVSAYGLMRSCRAFLVLRLLKTLQAQPGHCRRSMACACARYAAESSISAMSLSRTLPIGFST